MSTSYEKIDELIRVGKLDAKLRQVMRRKSDMSDNLLDLYSLINWSQNPFFTQYKLPSGRIIISKDTKPIFFQQMEEGELLKDYDVCQFKLGANMWSQYDYCHGVSIGLRNGISGTRKLGSNDDLADRAGLRPQLDSENPQVFYETRSQTDRVNRYEWMADGLFGYDDKPHVLMMSYHITEGYTPHVLRSELMLLIRAMLWKGRRTNWLHHDIIPALLISIRPNHIHIIESYYDGENVHVQYGSPIALDEDTPPKEQQKIMESLYRWVASKPQGDTTSYNSPTIKKHKKPSP